MACNISKIILSSLLAIAFYNGNAQKNKPAKATINTSSFQNSTHHWYDIFDKSNVINPVANQPRYSNTDIIPIGENILLYQKKNGGWPKNYDMLAILKESQKDSLEKVKNILNTTFDNSTTYSHVACLAEIYHITKLEKFRAGALRGIKFILKAQYPNGGWPQYFPLVKNYSKEITFNDDMFTGIMNLLKAMKEKKTPYSFVSENLRKKISVAWDKGISCILKTQINDNGYPTAWCQQYDATNLQPAWARSYEPPSICNNESAGVILFLMSIDKPITPIIKAVDHAVNWFNESRIYETRMVTVAAKDTIFQFRHSTTDKVIIKDPSAPPIWTRFYELKTHRPLFCNRDGKVVYSLAEVARERRDGYGWYTYEPQKVLDKYPAWHKKVTGK